MVAFRRTVFIPATLASIGMQSIAGSIVLTNRYKPLGAHDDASSLLKSTRVITPFLCICFKISNVISVGPGPGKPLALGHTVPILCPVAECNANRSHRPTHRSGAGHAFVFSNVGVSRSCNLHNWRHTVGRALTFHSLPESVSQKVSRSTVSRVVDRSRDSNSDRIQDDRDRTGSEEGARCCVSMLRLCARIAKTWRIIRLFRLRCSCY